MKNWIIISDQESLSQTFENLFAEEVGLDFFPHQTACLNKTYPQEIDLIFIDLICLKNFKTQVFRIEQYQECLAPFKEKFPNSKIILLVHSKDSKELIYAYKAGADYSINYPISKEEILYICELEDFKNKSEQEKIYLKHELFKDDSTYITNTNSAKMQKIFEKIKAVASTKSTVLLTGETGVGKGALARLIHQSAQRSKEKFIGVHCGAIPENLIETELFGHEKGAFTGAIKKKLGKFELAHKGTLFLDEISTISSSLQIKLLQFLQEKTINRVGSEEEIEVDVRIIAATNENLADLVSQKLFREDLFYRLNVFPIEIPPLRDRIEDLPLLSQVFLTRLNNQYRKNIETISTEVLEAFSHYHWPGNIRELENLMERAYILETSQKLTPEVFPSEIFSHGSKNVTTLPFITEMTLSQARQNAIETFERNYLKQVLQENHGKVNLSAEQAGITSRQLHKLLSKYQINKKEYKVNKNMERD